MHELHIWRLNQQKSIASAHIVIDHSTDFMAVANTINECLHAYGIHSATLQPEVIPNPSTREDLSSPTLASAVSCLLGCQSSTNCLQVGCCGLGYRSEQGCSSRLLISYSYKSYIYL